MKNILTIAVVAVVAFFGVQFLRGTSEITPEKAQEVLMQSAQTPSQRALYETLAEKFPEEHDAFLERMAAAMNASDSSQQAAFAMGQQYTARLRQENSKYIAKAPLSDLAVVRATNIELMEGLQAEPEICAVYAMHGGAALSFEQAKKLNLELIGASSNALFRAMAAGRDTPVEHRMASEADVGAVFEQWRAEPDVTEGYVEALMQGNVNHPDVCAASLSFERFVHESDDETVQSVGIYLIQFAAGS